MERLIWLCWRIMLHVSCSTGMLRAEDINKMQQAEVGLHTRKRRSLETHECLYKSSHLQSRCARLIKSSTDKKRMCFIGWRVLTLSGPVLQLRNNQHASGSCAVQTVSLCSCSSSITPKTSVAYSAFEASRGGPGRLCEISRHGPYEMLPSDESSSPRESLFCHAVVTWPPAHTLPTTHWPKRKELSGSSDAHHPDLFVFPFKRNLYIRKLHMGSCTLLSLQGLPPPPFFISLFLSLVINDWLKWAALYD